MLTVDSVRLAYGDHVALRGVSFCVPTGSVTALIGPNGAGKSTLLSLCAGLSAPDDGALSFDGRPIEVGSRSRAGLVGFASQEIALYRPLNTIENLAFYAELFGIPRAARRAAIDAVVETLELGPFARRPVGRLSGGEQRRVHVAAALVHRPPLLLLDEPTAGVDVATRALVIAAVQRHADRGATVLYSTHYFSEVEHLGAPLVLLDLGEVIARGRPDELVRAQRGETTVEAELAAPGQLPPPWVTTGCLARCSTRQAESVVSDLVAWAGSRGLRLRGIRILEPSLEAAFLHLTGRHIEEGEAGRGPADASVPVPGLAAEGLAS